MGKCNLHASLFIFDRIIIKVAGYQDRQKSLHEFDFGPGQTTHFGVTCPWLTKILHFRTWISLRPVGQSWSNFMCSITVGEERLRNVLRQIGSKLWCPWQQKAPHWLIMGKMVSPPFLGWFWSDPFCRTCFSMGDLGVQVSVRSSVRPSVNIYPGCLVSATPLTVLYRSFWNFACVFIMVWGCACGLDIIVRLFFVTFSTLWT